MSAYNLVFAALLVTLTSTAQAEPIDVGSTSLPFGSPTLIAGEPLQVGAVYEYRLGTFPSLTGSVELRARVSVIAAQRALLTRLDAGSQMLAPAITSEGNGLVDLQVDFVDVSGLPLPVKCPGITVSGLAAGARVEITTPLAYTVDHFTALESRIGTLGRYVFTSSTPAGTSFEKTGVYAEYGTVTRLFVRLATFVPGTVDLTMALGAPVSVFANPVRRAPRCADGRRELPEACDDGNQLNGDGCDSYCRPEMALWLNSPSPLRRPRLSGGAVPGESVTVWVDGFQGRTTAGENGFWNYVAPIDLADGPHTITATSADYEGRMTSITDVLLVDTVAEFEPLFPSSQAHLVAGQVTFSGLGEEGAYVWIELQGPTQAYGSPRVVDGGWTWSTTLPSGRYIVSSGTRDVAGNTFDAVPFPIELVACQSDSDCTRGIACQSDGMCENRPPCGCDDGDPCTEDRCEGETCVFEARAEGDVCDGGFCDGAPTPSCMECLRDEHCGGGETCVQGRCYDMSPPRTSWIAPTWGAQLDGTEVELRGATEVGASLVLTVSGEANSDTFQLTPDQLGNFEVVVSDVRPGPYEAVVVATDPAGNRAEARTSFWVMGEVTEPVEPVVPRPNPEDPLMAPAAGCASGGAWGGLGVVGLLWFWLGYRGRFARTRT